MALAIGFLLLILGAALTVAWWPFVLAVLKGALALSFLFWGALSVIVGAAGFKAKRELQTALNDAPSEAEKNGESAPETG